MPMTTQLATEKSSNWDGGERGEKGWSEGDEGGEGGEEGEGDKRVGGQTLDLCSWG